MGEQAWPIDEIRSCNEAEKADQNEALFKKFRKTVLASDSDDVEAEVRHAELVWAFLIDCCRRFPQRRNQVFECVAVLNGSEAWRDIITAKHLQEKVNTLPEDARVPFGAQPEAILLSSLSGSSVEKLRPKVEPSSELGQEQAQYGVVGYKEASRLRSNLIGDTDDVSKHVNRDDLSDGIKAVLAIDTHAKWENDAVKAFTQLRRACLHVAGDTEAFQREAANAVGVMNFLIDFVIRHRLRVRQACEILHLIMACSAWATALKESATLKERVHTELGEDVQAAFGLQSEAVMDAISPAARKKAALAEAAGATSEVSDIIKKRPSELGLPPSAELMEEATAFDGDDPFHSEDEAEDIIPLALPLDDSSVAARGTQEKSLPLPDSLSACLRESSGDEDVPPPPPAPPQDGHDELTLPQDVHDEPAPLLAPRDQEEPPAAPPHDGKEELPPPAPPQDEPAPPPPPDAHNEAAPPLVQDDDDEPPPPEDRIDEAQPLEPPRDRHDNSPAPPDKHDEPPPPASYLEGQDASQQVAPPLDGHKQPVSPCNEIADDPAIAKVSDELVDAQRLALSMRRMRQGLKRRLRWQSTIEEMYYDACIDANVEATWCRPPRQNSNSADVWEEALTPDGKKYFWNTRSRETRWKLPTGAMTAPAPLIASEYGLKLGCKVEVFSNSRQVWCSGIVEKLCEQVACVSFRLPGSSAYQLARKDVFYGSKDLRLVDWHSLASCSMSSRPVATIGDAEKPEIRAGAQNSRPSNQAYPTSSLARSHHGGRVECVELSSSAKFSMPQTAVLTTGSDSCRRTPGHQREVPVGSPNTANASIPNVTAGHLHFTSEERTHYEMLYRKVVAKTGGSPEGIPQYLASSFLPRKVMKEIWSVANPEMKPTLNLEAFAKACRLIAHCQAMQGSPPHRQLLVDGDRPLRVFLREKCLGKQPMHRPHFG